MRMLLAPWTNALRPVLGRWVAAPALSVLAFLRYLRLEHLSSRAAPARPLSHDLTPEGEAGPLGPVIEAISSTSLPLSIVIPVFNAGERLRRCLDSVVSQVTAESFEVICVDDGSTDASREMLDSYAARYPFVTVLSQANRGISAARNTGISRSVGRYVAVVDNDDALEPAFVRQTLAACESGSAIVRSGYVQVDEASGARTEVVEQLDPLVQAPLGRKLSGLDGYAWGTLFRRDLFEKVGFPEGYWYEDMITRLLLYRLADSFGYVAEPLYLKYDHTSNAAKVVWDESSPKCLDQLRLLEEIHARAQAIGLLFDDWTYQLYLSEAGPFLHLRTRGLTTAMRRRTFARASLFIRALEPPRTEMTLSWAGRMFDASFRHGDYRLWDLLGQRCRAVGTTRIWHA